ncbi:tRNA dimethylallyltransferase [Oceanicella actignis]|uniref:tRNA dimethylallyltransferase n=2 Tax=Oceanicella actignis TaxID=1189325 RepID=A0A1M7U073_9RHOB|nr:tRNA dimethylallyltransferase [Oceanicella actignis]SHN76442.1 tRNA dimethylallyltransferase [Oceanicella actignis]
MPREEGAPAPGAEGGARDGAADGAPGAARDRTDGGADGGAKTQAPDEAHSAKRERPQDAKPRGARDEAPDGAAGGAAGGAENPAPDGARGGTPERPQDAERRGAHAGAPDGAAGAAANGAESRAPDEARSGTPERSQEAERRGARDGAADGAPGGARQRALAEMPRAARQGAQAARRGAQTAQQSAQAAQQGAQAAHLPAPLSEAALALRPVLVAGPTASGKSALALALAERLNGCVINADAIQVYGGWRVLSARPSADDEARAPHLLYGHVPMQDAHSTGRWLAEAARAIEDCARRGQTPIVVGGTGLYFAALTQGLAPIPPTPPEIRARVEALFARGGAAALREALAARDPDTLARIDARNPMRLMRALEALETTGLGLSALQARTPPPPLPPERARLVRLMPEREALYARIEARFDAMLAEGALDEAAAAAALDPPASAQAMNAIGARELIAHLHGRMTLDEARARAVQATRNYAKRQLTWLRNRMRAWPAAPDARTALALVQKS